MIKVKDYKEFFSGEIKIIVQDKNGNYFVFDGRNEIRKQKIKRIYDRRV